jgi:GNAT superfamily N-acetyltransferase
MAPHNIEVVRIEKAKDLNRFIRLPWEIYKNDPNWVPPLMKDVKFKLDRARHPFFDHAKMDLFVAIQGNDVVGRIAAILDERHNKVHQEHTGFFGMFECIENYDVAHSLFSTAENWCRDQGMDRIRGPVNLSMNDECGFLLEGFDSSPVIKMTYNPRYYLDFCDRYGFVKAKDLFAFLKDEVGVVGRIANIVERVRQKENVVIRHIDMKRYVEEVEIIKDIYNAAWELNWGFVPMTSRDIDLLAQELKPILEPELVLFAEVDGRPVGISITIPDYNQVLKRINGKLGPISILKILYYRRKITGVRGIAFGIKKEYQKTGINAVLYYETEMASARLGYTWCEMSWNLEDNKMINNFDEAIGGKLYKKYRIVEKSIS